MTWGTSHGAEANSAAVNGENADALALVPFRPSLHAVLLTIWAAAQPEFPSCEADAQPATLIIDFSSSQDQHVPTDSVTILDIDDTGDLSAPFVSLSDDQVPAKKCLGPLLDAAASSTGAGLPPR